MDLYSSSESSKYWVNDFFLPKINERREKFFKPRAEFIAYRTDALLMYDRCMNDLKNISTLKSK